ncbi:cleft lip and palate transmembrane 1 [Athelia psychrophila]|uniref:Cleft lip and palate transmembrane 1 n=1 Tax=Athelia psychrophila TaxID=1759441 RepID=A0A166CAT5_9AGAM|nr:cleft lip and palate transmembrane 1 [Fibularhizoctonia sp. CBS 109695]
MHVHLSTSPTGDVFSAQWTSAWRKDADEGLPSFKWENITYGDWQDTRVVDLDVALPEHVMRNGSLWADMFLMKDGASPNPAHANFDPHSVHHTRKLLTRYLPKIKVRKEKVLIGGSEDVTSEDTEDEVISHWHQNLTLALISDSTVMAYNQLQPAVSEHVHLIPGQRDATGTQGYYLPIVFPNDFWCLRSQFIEINSTTPTLPLQIVFQPMSYFKFQLFASMSHGFNEATKQKGAAGSSSAEIDEIKRMLVETNPWFLGLTGLVSILHVLFEMLAFKSDVSDWRQKKELVGVSIVTNVFVQTIILLYLLDNNTDTSWMILMGSGMGVLIEAWKITKAVDINIKPSSPGAWLPYQLDIKDKHVLSEDEKKTQEYDKLAYRYVSYVAIPCLAGYTIYSMLYETHRGWYSFVISTLTSFVYMFGFAQLIPQLIINYKLKSVSHMNGRSMGYKFLSTIVDDLFAFCIKMPFLHRLACFRDDAVFLVFLYQRYIYRVDPNRVNEYGQVLDDAHKVDEKGESKKDK